MSLSKLKALHKMQAVRKFTNREAARDSFFRAFENYLADKAPLLLLMYYGVGGIGKTSLLKHLKSEIEATVRCFSWYLSRTTIGYRRSETPAWSSAISRTSGEP